MFNYTQRSLEISRALSIVQLNTRNMPETTTKQGGTKGGPRIQAKQTWFTTLVDFDAKQLR